MKEHPSSKPVASRRQALGSGGVQPRRIVLEVEAVRMEHLRDISGDDARAEGFLSRLNFLEAWGEQYSGLGISNPLVWAIKFQRVRG